jgi:hypothetical protein
MQSVASSIRVKTEIIVPDATLCNKIDQCEKFEDTKGVSG